MICVYPPFKSSHVLTCASYDQAGALVFQARWDVQGVAFPVDVPVAVSQVVAVVWACLAWVIARSITCSISFHEGSAIAWSSVDGSSSDVARTAISISFS